MVVLDRAVVRDALRAYSEPGRLAAHQLAVLRIAGGNGTAADPTMKASERARRLRAVLLEAIESLRPGEVEPTKPDKSWRAYQVLSRQFIDCFSQSNVAAQMAVSRSQFHVEQSNALDRIAAILLEWEEKAAASSAKPAGAIHNASVVPRASIPYLAPLIGRDAIIMQIKNQLMTQPGNTLIAISGLPGVGKTTLVRHLEQDADIRAVYSDGTLWAGLGQRPDIRATLTAWTVRLGIPAEALNQYGSDEVLAAQVHLAIGDRRMLLIIDDAWSPENALALRVGGVNCSHILTTRLTGVAAYFAYTGAMTLEELPIESSRDLISTYCPGLADKYHDKVQGLLQTTGGLPLTITLIGRYLHMVQLGKQPRRMLHALQKLTEPSARLDLTQPPVLLETQHLLSTPASLSLRAVIQISVEALDPESRQALFALSILHPKPASFSEDAALAVSDASVDALDALVDYGLLESLPDGRYSMHQSINDYAGLARDSAVTHAAKQRMITYYLDFLAVHHRNTSAIEQEYRPILESMSVGSTAEPTTRYVRAANLFFRFLEARGIYHVAGQYLEAALRQAAIVHDYRGQATTLLNLGRIAIKAGDFALAAGRLQESLVLARRMDDPETISAALQHLGTIAESTADYALAEQYYNEGLATSRRIDHQERASFLLLHLSGLSEQLGRYDAAALYARDALTLAQQTSNQQGVCTAMAALGIALSKQGAFNEGASYLYQSYALLS